MGYIRHHAIVVTGSRYRDVRPNAERTDIDDAHAAASAAGCKLVSPIVGPGVNDTYSFLVAPDGSKEGWKDSDDGDTARDAFIAWMQDANGEHGGWFAWAEVVLGTDDAEAHVERHAWDEPDEDR